MTEEEREISKLLLDDIKNSDIKVIRDSSTTRYGRTTRSIAIENYVYFSGLHKIYRLKIKGAKIILAPFLTLIFAL